MPDAAAEAVNPNGNHSVRGGTLAQKCYNPDTPTRERLLYPMVRVAGILTPVSWDLATEVMAEVSKHVLRRHWSNNYMNTASIAALGLICGAGNRPGRVISRGGGHQRGWMGAGGGKGWLSPEKHPGRRKKSLNVDRWVMDGHVRFMWTIGLTWFPAMLASQALATRVPATAPCAAAGAWASRLGTLPSQKPLL